MTFNPRTANPFDSNNTFKEWSSNNLLLLDPAMRRKAGVTVLDNDVTEVFRLSAPAQKAGGPYGAPLHISQWASANAHPYDPAINAAWTIQAPLVHKLAAEQSGGMPSHYYNNDHRW